MNFAQLNFKLIMKEVARQRRFLSLHLQDFCGVKTHLDLLTINVGEETHFHREKSIVFEQR